MRSETEAALAAVAAGLELARRRPGADRITSKGGRDLVTATDVAVEDVIRATLLDVFPAWTVVGEERGGEDRIGDRPYWLVDPICGTRNFASNLPLYAVNVALVENGVVTVSAVGDGGTGDRFAAERGQGAWLLSDGARQRLRASADSLVLSLSPHSPKFADRATHGAELTRAILLADRWDLRVVGTTLSYAHVAAGQIAAYLLMSISSPVHTAAGCLLAEEAGASVTDLDGQPWSVASRQLLASATPELHAELLALVAATAPR